MRRITTSLDVRNTIPYKDNYVRNAADKAIGQLGSAATRESQVALVKALGHEDKQVRHDAASAIGLWDVSLLIITYCQQDATREALMPYITKKLYSERLVIAGQQLTLYQRVGSVAIEGLPTEGIKALQAALAEYREEVLKASRKGVAENASSKTKQEDIEKDPALEDKKDDVKSS
ncbi:MAG: hypothetical protein AAFP93_02235 [Bacteroidota bacterium]